MVSNPAALERGTDVGGFVVIDRLGAGGMAVVYAAYDPKLDRKVALKVLDREEPDTDRRLLREAQALARLTHPNVVAVHDAGEHNGRVWIAMEYVEGETLLTWSKAARRWQTVVAVFRQAGAGLAAAHEAKLLHRDFKPENVMIGTDGRARVMDFGLARGTGDIDPQATEGELVDLGERMTQTGAVVGTPAYMSPEQITGGAVGPASDQFAFFVALWEVLFGKRPFTGRTITALTEALLHDPRPKTPAGRKAPGWLVDVCARGLARKPSDRFPDMAAALSALARGSGRRRRRLALLTTAAAALAAAGTWGMHRRAEAQQRSACESSGNAIEEVWNADSRARIQDALLATGVSYAATTAERTDALIDTKARAWQEARAQACIAAEVEQRWDADTDDRARWCLEERRLAIASLVATLETVDAVSADRAISAAGSLRGVAPCVAVAALAKAHPSPPVERRAELGEVRRDLARAHALSAAGRFGAALDLADAASTRAGELDWPPLSARATLLKAHLLTDTGDVAGGIESARTAYWTAFEARAWGTAAGAANALVIDRGYRQTNLAEGQAWAEQAATAIVLAGDPLGDHASARASNLAAANLAAGRHEEALALAEASLALNVEHLGEAHPDVARSLHNLGQIHFARGDYDAAEDALEDSYARKQASFGPDHPTTANTLATLAQAHFARGEYDEAIARGERALSLREAALGPEHFRVAADLRLLGLAALRQGRLSQAADRLERAIEIGHAAFGDRDAKIANYLQDLGAVRVEQGDLDAGEARYREALDVMQAAVGEEHKWVGHILHNLALLEYRREHYAEAEALHERAARIYEAQLGPEHPDLASTLYGLAQARHKLDATRDVIALVERALEILERKVVDGDPLRIAVDAFLTELREAEQ